MALRWRPGDVTSASIISFVTRSPTATLIASRPSRASSATSANASCNSADNAGNTVVASSSPTTRLVNFDPGPSVACSPTRDSQGRWAGSPLPVTTPRWNRSSRCSSATSSTVDDGGPRNEFAYAISFWIEHTYNRRRRQRSLGKLTPVEFELAFTPAEAHVAA